VYRRARKGVEFLLGKHSGYHKWVLPKGLVERGEGPIETAIREVEEELGVKARIREIVPVKTIEYWYYAEPGGVEGVSGTGRVSERRVKKYQEEMSAGEKKQLKSRIHKRVIFYLMEAVEVLESHGWEMSERRFVSYEEAMVLLAFESEREVLESASKLL